MVVRSLLRPVVATLALLAATSPLLAQQQKQPNTQQPGVVKSNHGGEQCALMQNVIADDRPEVGLSVVVLKTADRKATILRVLAPLGVLLPNGLGLNIDGNDIGKAYFVRCFSDGCYSEVVLDDTKVKDDEQTLKVLLAGKTATFIVFQSPEEGIGIPVDLNGFREGYQALP
jgi:invasion protein IalB